MSRLNDSSLLSLPPPARLGKRQGQFGPIWEASCVSGQDRPPRMTRWIQNIGGARSPPPAPQDPSPNEKMSTPDESSSSILNEDDESAEPLPKGITLALIVFALCMSILVMSLDNNVIATAIPTITTEFASLPDMGWYGSAYLLTTASLQLLFGKLYTFFSIKWVFLAAVAVFELGSLVCGLARDSATLIAGRAVAGVGGAGIFSGAFTVLAYSVPLEKRPVYTGGISE
ncbi:hypothetical protein VUR80DRAFT_5946 [Thermomyces stellatus]